MKTEEIDKIIAEAIEKDKGRKQKTGKTGIDKARRILNILFMCGFVVAIIIYFVLPDQKILFFSVGFGAMFLKIIEFFLRFLF